MDIHERFLVLFVDSLVDITNVLFNYKFTFFFFLVLLISLKYYLNVNCATSEYSKVLVLHFCICTVFGEIKCSYMA